MSGYISFEENESEKGDKLIFHGDTVDTCYGICAILRGACEYTGLTLEQLIEVVYTAMKNSNAENIRLYAVPKGKLVNDETIARFDRDGFTRLNGSTEEIMAAITILIREVCKETGLSIEEALLILSMGLKMAEEDSAPADGSSTGRKEGIT